MRNSIDPRYSPASSPFALFTLLPLVGVPLDERGDVVLVGDPSAVLHFQLTLEG